MALLTCSAIAWASGGTGEYTLNWPVRGELLAYHSSGCADACWVAEVRKKSTRQVRARLRCDGDQLYFSRAGKSKEQLLPEGCASYNDSNDKPRLISEKLMMLLRDQQGQVRK
ncbi:hypothetical protein [Undibacterium sp. YM2]|uniref:hypothetical protein n=1 Tax=Undibacterium sp. YM2 TaxID=2058625 RepID=UPI001389C1F6|nr:hypothetical protein [Undibacterium sp. YM2]